MILKEQAPTSEKSLSLKWDILKPLSKNQNLKNFLISEGFIKL